jgi:hypothetical protein
MSFYFTVYIGPYAEWRVRRGREAEPPVDEQPWYTPLIEEEILVLAQTDGIPQIKAGRARFAQYRFLPKQKQPNRPPREM